MNEILVVVDMQNDFISGPLGTKEACAITEYVREAVDRAHYNGVQVIFTQDTHDRDYLNTQEGKRLPVEHCIENTTGWQIYNNIAQIIDINDDIILQKPTFGTFDLAEEIEFIAEALGSVERITLMGLCTGICVLTNAAILKTAFPETTIVVDANGSACVTPASHKTALDAMRLLQIEIIGG